MWDLWWTKWHWDRFVSEFLGFPRQYHSTVVVHTYVYHLEDEQQARWWLQFRDTVVNKNSTLPK
jgi:hypothetical protein